jgi:hypothetical protein
MVTTRLVLALVAGALLSAGGVWVHQRKHVYATWSLALGFLAASVWGGLTVALADRGAAGMPRESAIALTTMAIALTIYFGIKAANREPVR